jgi:hypothetical protein
MHCCTAAGKKSPDFQRFGANNDSAAMFCQLGGQM